MAKTTSGDDRRRGQRFSTDLEVEWETSATRSSGMLSDISESGCLVLSGGAVSEGEQVRLFFPIGDGMRVEFAGSVVTYTEEVGFSVQFSEVSPAQRDLIAKIVRDSAE